MPLPTDPRTPTGLVELRRLAVATLGQYALQLGRLRLLSRHEHAVFRAEAIWEGAEQSERFALRLYDPAVFHRPSVMMELEWLSALGQDLGLGVPLPLRNRTGGWLTTLPGLSEPGRSGVLFRWVDGRRRKASLTPAAMEQVGRFVARLHLHAERFVPGAGEGGQRWDWERVFGDGSIVGPESVDPILEPDARVVFRRTAMRLRTVMEELGTSPERWGIIHGDLHSSNYLFHRGEVRAIDFEDCGWGHYLYDLAVVLDDIHASFPDRAGGLKEGLLRGYRLERPLSDADERLIDHFVAMRLAELVRWYGTSGTPEHLAVARQVAGEAVAWMARLEAAESRG